ncbi:hypothetical protein AVEN_89958-1 [Araneus ventricosus]|uniref:Uncharacterized protein n=1 Tax=Araneus ventricosus TaxID=182803 RepID=A0A4Y2SRH4_ARAVE|nr:hypothetical protein AVEN_89958-1 [Araneus ventricosus]
MSDEQDRGCRPCDPISPISGDECVLFCPLLCGVLQSPRKKNPLVSMPFLQSCDQREVLRHPSSPFSCIEDSTIKTSLPKQRRGTARCEELP